MTSPLAYSPYHAVPWHITCDDKSLGCAVHSASASGSMNVCSCHADWPKLWLSLRDVKHVFVVSIGPLVRPGHCSSFICLWFLLSIWDNQRLYRFANHYWSTVTLTMDPVLLTKWLQFHHFQITFRPAAIDWFPRRTPQCTGWNPPDVDVAQPTQITVRQIGQYELSSWSRSFKFIISIFSFVCISILNHKILMRRSSHQIPILSASSLNITV